MNSESVTIREVGLRDGLQLVSIRLPTEIKLEWCRRQLACGFTQMEVTSFVPPAVIAQFADAADVLKGAMQIPGLHTTVLVPNLKWGKVALDNGAEKVMFVLSVSEAHNQANVRRSTDQSIVEINQLINERNQRGLQGKVEIAAAMATTFGCSFQGNVVESRVYDIADQLLQSGIDEINVCDTVGYGNPVQVKRIMGKILSLADSVPVAAHFHDTRGMGIANTVASLEVGVRRFDSSMGGLGGCPFAKGASGNIATEDCAYLMESMGLSTGVDFAGMLELREQLSSWLDGELLEGKLLKAGPAINFSNLNS